MRLRSHRKLPEEAADEANVKAAQEEVKLAEKAKTAAEVARKEKVRLAKEAQLKCTSSWDGSVFDFKWEAEHALRAGVSRERALEMCD